MSYRSLKRACFNVAQFLGLDTFSRIHLETLLGQKAVEVLQRIYRYANKFDAYKGYAIVKLPFIPEGYNSSVGFVRFEEVDVPYVQIKHWEKNVSSYLQ
jgi:hypothetical protein